MTRRTLVIDPDASEGVALFPADGEFARAVAAGALREVPDDVALTLYAYELVERWRDTAPAWVVHAPLCPLTIMTAADLHAHAGRELVAMLGDPVRVVRAASESAITRAMEHWLGAPRFHAPDYLTSLAAPREPGS